MTRSSINALQPSQGGTPASRYAALASHPWSSGASQLTLSFWVNHGSAFVDREGLFGNWDAALNGKVLLRLSGTSGAFQAFVYTSSGQFGPRAGPANFSANTWQHVCLCLDGSNMYLWLDGSKSSGTSYSGTLNTSGSVPRIGYVSGSQVNCAAWFRDMAFWDGVALPDATVTALANGMNPLAAAPSHYWSLDHDPGETVGKDLCGKNDFTINYPDADFESNTFTGNYSWLPYPTQDDWMQEVAESAGGGSGVVSNIFDGVIFA